jgi:hypothetical protein
LVYAPLAVVEGMEIFSTSVGIDVYSPFGYYYSAMSNSGGYGMWLQRTTEEVGDYPLATF